LPLAQKKKEKIKKENEKYKEIKRALKVTKIHNERE